MRRPTPHVLAGAVVALAVALTVGPAPTGAADPSGEPEPPAARPVPTDRPFPGYTVDNPRLEPLTVRGGPTRVFQGVVDHAAYDVEVPRRWNGQLMMWAHGFRGPTRTLTVDPPAFGLRRRVLSQGYAWAASSYTRNDYDVATGVRTTRSLAEHAATLLPRRPTRTYLAGVSMGGHVIGRSLEQYPGAYDGALPMCGVMGDQALFDYFLGYNLLAQDLADVPAYPPPADYPTDEVPRIQSALGIGTITPSSPRIDDPEGQQLRALTVELTGGPRPGTDGAFASWKDFLFTLATPDTGGSLAQNPSRVAQNTGVTYRPSRPVDVDATVQRVRARDDDSRRTTDLTQVPKIAGRPRVPVLTLHGLGDLFVPFSMEQAYRREVRDRGLSRLLVQRAVRAAGHCEFTPGEAGRAWDDLTRWVGSGGRERPKGDDVLRRPVVAAPDYGCRFTDPRGYADAAAYPSRRIYARCPAKG